MYRSFANCNCCLYLLNAIILQVWIREPHNCWYLSSIHYSLFLQSFCICISFPHLNGLSSRPTNSWLPKYIFIYQKMLIQNWLDMLQCGSLRTFVTHHRAAFGAWKCCWICQEVHWGDWGYSGRGGCPMTRGSNVQTPLETKCVVVCLDKTLNCFQKGLAAQYMAAAIRWCANRWMRGLSESALDDHNGARKALLVQHSYDAVNVFCSIIKCKVRIQT